jgi:hypothetical protein
MCVAAPARKRTKNTTVIGTSRDFVGTPPSIASGGAKGPRPIRCSDTVGAGMRFDAAVALPIADESEEDGATRSVEFSNLPADRPRTSEGSNSELGDGSTKLAAGVVETIEDKIVG